MSSELGVPVGPQKTPMETLQLRGTSIPRRLIMDLSSDTNNVIPAGENASGISRRVFFKQATLVGATSALALSGLAGLGVASGQESDAVDAQGLKSGDRAILIAA